MSAILSNLDTFVQVGVDNQAVAYGFAIAAGRSFTLTQIAFLLKVSSPSPIGPSDVRVYLSQGDTPPANLTSVPMQQLGSFSLIDGSYREYSVNAATSTPLESGKKYWVILTASGPGASWLAGGPFQCAGATPLDCQLYRGQPTWTPSPLAPLLSIMANSAPRAS